MIEIDKLKAMPLEAQENIKGILQMFDTEYGADRNKYKDNGGDVIVVNRKESVYHESNYRFRRI